MMRLHHHDMTLVDRLARAILAYRAEDLPPAHMRRALAERYPEADGNAYPVALVEANRRSRRDCGND